MSHITANGFAVVGGTLWVPRQGAWHGDLAVLGDELGDQVEIGIGSLRWKGTAKRSGKSGASTFVRVVGGKGGMGRTLAPRAYQGVPLSLPLGDIVVDAGEALAATCDASILGTYVGNWARMRQPAGLALAALLGAAGSPTWRVLAGGGLWVGTDRWAASALADYVVTDEMPHLGQLEVAADEPVVFPGEVFRDRRVTAVEHRFSQRALRTRVWMEALA